MDERSGAARLLRWRTLASVLIGAVVTLVFCGGATLVLPLLVLLTAALVGDWVPLWAFALLPVGGALAGGAVAGFVQNEGPGIDALVGGLGSALGVAVVGVGVGLVLLVVMLGMVPGEHPVDASEPARQLAALGAVAGFVAGTVLGAVGGLAGHAGRRRFG